MKQSEVAAPVVAVGPWRPLLSAARLHAGAALLRNLVWLMTGNGRDFDAIFYLDTPGLGESRVRCALCRPNRTEVTQGGDPRPLVLVLEGGGFVLGQPEDGQKHDRNISDELDAVVISIDYAKAPRYPYPHALLQAYEVLKWALSPAAHSYGIKIDPSRVAVMGNSAGGNLTATLSLLLSFTSGPNAKFRESLPPDFCQKLQLLIYPSIETGRPYRQRFHRATAEVQKKSLPIGVAELMEDSYLPPHIDRDQIFVRPLMADQALLRDLKPPLALVLTAGMDCLKAEADAYATKLREAGIAVTEQDYPEAIHGFSHYTKGRDFRPDDVQHCWQQIHEALRTAFH